MRVQILPEDYIAATRLPLRPRKSWAVIGVVLLMLATLVIVNDFWDVLRGKGHVWKDVGLTTIIAYFAGWYFVFIPVRVRRIYAQQRALHEPFEMTFDENGIFANNARADGKLPWEYIHRWRESETLFVLYQMDALFNILPKRCFVSSAEINHFRILLVSQVGPSAPFQSRLMRWVKARGDVK